MRATTLGWTVLLSACGGTDFRSASARDGGTDPPQALVDAAADAEAGSPATSAASCAALLAARPELKGVDGVRLIVPAAGAPAIDVYCDMTLDGGGWTLVGRSAKNGGGSFGWKVDAGNVGNDAQPYSLDVRRARLVFAEILFGSYDTGKKWGSNVYRHVVPQGFVQTYGATGFAPATGAVTVVGSCSPQGGPSMVSFVGFTDQTDHFFFRDNTDNSFFGLYPDGFNTNAPPNQPGSCEYSAELGAKQGMIMVR